MLLFFACSSLSSRPLPEASSADTSAAPLDEGLDSGEPDCPPGIVCVDALPFTTTADTLQASSSELDAYACAPDTDESGPEIVYQVQAEGFLSAVLVEGAEGVDVDLHILDALDPDACLDRGNSDVGADVSGTVYVVVDTYVSEGEALAGAYTLTIDRLVPASGDCAMESGWMDRINDDGVWLELPATGPVVKEAHLVTEEDGYGTTAADPWPQSSTEGLDDHLARAMTRSRVAMDRTQSWAPQESSEFGQSASGDKLPVEDETWYVNMYWEDRPDAGTRMILRTAEGRAVVAAAGYETGPGDLSHIAGTTEEVHHYLGTGHLSELTVGFAVDQTLPLGPIVCD